MPSPLQIIRAKATYCCNLYDSRLSRTKLDNQISQRPMVELKQAAPMINKTIIHIDMTAGGGDLDMPALDR